MVVDISDGKKDIRSKVMANIQGNETYVNKFPLGASLHRM